MTRREEGLINGEAKIGAFLTHLAVYKEVSLPTQGEALNHWCFYTLSGCMKVIESALTIS